MRSILLVGILLTIAGGVFGIEIQAGTKFRISEGWLTSQLGPGLDDSEVEAYGETVLVYENDQLRLAGDREESIPLVLVRKESAGEQDAHVYRSGEAMLLVFENDGQIVVYLDPRYLADAMAEGLQEDQKSLALPMAENLSLGIGPILLQVD